MQSILVRKDQFRCALELATTGRLLTSELGPDEEEEKKKIIIIIMSKPPFSH